MWSFRTIIKGCIAVVFCVGSIHDVNTYISLSNVRNVEMYSSFANFAWESFSIQSLNFACLYFFHKLSLPEKVQMSAFALTERNFTAWLLPRALLRSVGVQAAKPEVPGLWAFSPYRTFSFALSSASLSRRRSRIFSCGLTHVVWQFYTCNLPTIHMNFEANTNYRSDEVGDAC